MRLATAGRAAERRAAKPDAPKIAPVVESIPVKPGDRWTYRWVDDITGESKSYQTYTLTEIKDGAFSVAITMIPIGQGQPTSGSMFMTKLGGSSTTACGHARSAIR